MNTKNSTSEPNPLFPSGPWNGFYTYSQGPNADRHSMPSNLTFSKGKVSGGGSDDVGSFSWSGTYDTKNPNAKMTKKYAPHTIPYQGRVDNNGIWRTWTMMGWTGGFHLWPTEVEKGEKEEEALLKELLKEVESVEFF
ncbi:MAG: hypothetical protein ACI8YQ_004521 [Polaribacter sp.]|jgi:hypothetical protein